MIFSTVRHCCLCVFVIAVLKAKSATATINQSQEIVTRSDETFNQFDHVHPIILKPPVLHQEPPKQKHEHDPDEDDHSDGHQGHHGIRLASWRWKEYWELITFCLIIIMAGIFKLAFHHTPILPQYLPESCVLILIGIISGCFIYYGINSHQYPFPEFTSKLFFNFLLPPIVLDSAYSLYDRDFLYNIGSIIVFAVVGTLFNVFAVGFGLYFIEYLSKYR